MSLNLNTAKMQTTINRMRNELIKAIKDIVVDYLHGSGYMRGRGTSGEVLQLCTYGSHETDDGDMEVKYYLIDEDDEDSTSIMGFTQDGIINDAWVGLSTTDYEDLTIEVLIWVYTVAKITHTELQ